MEKLFEMQSSPVVIRKCSINKYFVDGLLDGSQRWIEFEME